MIRKILIAFVLLIAVVIGAGFAIYYDRADLSAYADLFVNEPARPGTIHVTSGGVATLLISDGETNLMIDGFFTRPGLTDALGNIAPDDARIDAGLDTMGASELAVVIPAHSHYDHAMDSPIVAQKTGAVLLGSRSSAMIARGLDFDEDRIIEARPGAAYHFGRFTVQLLPSRHVPLPYDGSGTIDGPLTPPVPFGAYKQGEAYSILIAHDNGTRFLVQGSAGYIENTLSELDLDAVFLGIGGLGGQPDSYKAAYWHEMVELTGAKTIIPIHWDNLFDPLSAELQTSPRLFDDFDATMAFIKDRAAREGRTVKLLQGLSSVNVGN